MSLLKISVVRGGPSGEYDVSLRTGQNILNNLNLDKYKVEDIFVSRDGVWYRHGLPISPTQALLQTDVLLNAMHGDYGEDGKLQREAERAGVAYTGSGAFGVSMSLNKDLAKGIYKKNYLKTPEHITFKSAGAGDLHKIALKIFREFPQPSIIKPVSGGSSKDIHYCSSLEDVYTAIDEISQKGQPFMVKEYIFGKEASVATLENFRNEDLYALPPIEVVKKSPYFSYEEKYEGLERNIAVPGSFSTDEKEMLKELAKEAHQSLGLRHYSQSDFIISPNGIYILETNALPGLTSTSLLPEALTSIGSSLPEFLDHLINLAQKK
jgi:D-alanine-D-alanine ligase